MSDADKSIKIKITSEADLAGFKATEKAMQDMGRAAGNEAAPAVSKSAEAINEVSRAAGAQAAPALDKVAEGTKKAGEASKGFAASAGKLFESLRTVTNLLPGLGMAGLVGLAWQGITKLIRPTDELAGKIDNLATKLSAIQDALAEGKLKTDAWEKGLAAISEKAESAAEHLKQVNDEIDRAKGRESRLLDAEQGVEMAKASQVKDPVKRKERELQIEQQFAERRMQVEMKSIANREAAEKMAVAQAAVQAKENGEKRKAAQDELTNLELQDKAAKERIEKERVRLEELDKAETGAEESLNAAQTGPHYGPYRSESIKQAEAALAKAQAERKAQESLVGGMEKDRLGIGEQMNKAKQDVKDYSDLEKSNKSFLNERARRPVLPVLQQDREQLEREFGLGRQARDIRGAGEIEGLRQQEAERRAKEASPRGGGAAGNPLVGEVNALRARADGLSDAEQQALAGAFGQLASSIERGMDKSRLASMINDLARRVGDMEKRQNTFRPVLPGH